MNPIENWYQQLTLQFADGTVEDLFLDISRSGRHRPRPDLMSAAWTKLAFEKCSCCTLTAGEHCPAALSLQETLLTLRQRKSGEIVNATAIDIEERTISVKSPLKNLGTVFVQIAVFCSGCPVGGRFRPMLRDLQIFATVPEMSKHLIIKHLLQHSGDAATAAQAVSEALGPLHEVFSRLFNRLQSASLESRQEAVPYSIMLMDSMTVCLSVVAKKLIAETIEGLRSSGPSGPEGAPRI